MFFKLNRRHKITKLERQVEANMRRLQLGLTQQERNEMLRKRRVDEALIVLFIAVAAVHVVFMLLNYPK